MPSSRDFHRKVSRMVPVTWLHDQSVSPDHARDWRARRESAFCLLSRVCSGFLVCCSRCRCSSQLCFPSRVSSWSPFPFIQTHLAQGLASSSLWLGFLPTISLLYGTRNPTGSEECQVRLLSSFRTFERLGCRKPISVYIYNTHLKVWKCNLGNC